MKQTEEVRVLDEEITMEGKHERITGVWGAL